MLEINIIIYLYLEWFFNSRPNIVEYTVHCKVFLQFEIHSFKHFISKTFKFGFKLNIFSIFLVLHNHLISNFTFRFLN